jgi:acylglycerol lipase
MTTKEEYLNSSEPVVELYTKTWIPTGKVKATVTFCHGIGEHIKRYEKFFEHFRSNGIKVTAFDQRGFGETGAKSNSKGECEDMETLIRDVKIIDAKARMGGIPHFVMGHSMGGLTALKFVHDHPQGITGVIASAPALMPGKDVMPNFIIKRILTTIAWFFPRQVIPNLVNTATLTRDPEVLKTFNADPLNFGYATMKIRN